VVCAIWGFHVSKRTGSVAHQRHGLAGCKESLDQFDGVLMFGEVPHWSVAAGIEHCVIIISIHGIEAKR
jgi:hypothetical protein